MDAFGIGAALQGAANIYFRSARRSGRTTELLNTLRDGDCVVCGTAQSGRHLELKLRERKLNVEVLVIDPTFKPVESALAGRPKPVEGRLVFDHDWLERYYLDLLADGAGYVDTMQARYSGSNEEPQPFVPIVDGFEATRWR